MAPPTVFPLCVFLWSPAGCFYSLLSKVDTFVRVSGQFRNQTDLENNSFAKASRGTILWKQFQTENFAMCYMAFYQNVPFLVHALEFLILPVKNDSLTGISCSRSPIQMFFAPAPHSQIKPPLFFLTDCVFPAHSRLPDLRQWQQCSVAESIRGTRPPAPLTCCPQYWTWLPVC